MSKRKPMIRKQLYIEPEQNIVLREQAAKYNVSEGQLVRSAITAYLTMDAQFQSSQEIDLSAWEEERQFILSRQSGPHGDDQRETQRNWSRGELYDL